MVESLTWAGRVKGRPWYEFHYLGWNNRLTEFQGAILRVQLQRLDEQNATRRENAAYLTRRLEQIDGFRPCKILDKSRKHSVHIYIIQYDQTQVNDLSRVKVIEALNAEGVPSWRAANRCLHLHPVFNTADVYGDGKPTRIAFSDRDLRQPPGTLPVSEAVHDRCLGVPWFKRLDRERIDDWVAAFTKVALQAGKLL